ncbi:hypothetical protein DVH05_024910 [Phytophthora capsici]|nr:hypothetical protein DVH05_024910 [Phytophthora capsici]
MFDALDAENASEKESAGCCCDCDDVLSFCGHYDFGFGFVGATETDSAAEDWSFAPYCLCYWWRKQDKLDMDTDIKFIRC